MLEIGLADDPHGAVRTVPIVSGAKPIESQRAHASASQMEQGGAADAARSQHDRIVMGHALL